MAGGPRKINDYNQSLSPEQRKANARKAATAKRPKTKLNANIRSIARIINDAPAGRDLKTALSILNVGSESMTNAAGIALSVYQAAIEGDMRAVEKWEKYVGQFEGTDKTKGSGEVRVIIDV